MPEAAKNSTKANKQKNVTIAKAEPGNGEIGGQLLMSEEVIATVAAYAASQVAGIGSIGKSGLNLALDGKPLLQTGPGKGVAVEVGSAEAAIDIEVTIEFGCDIQRVADELRARIAEAVERMAGRRVVEVNIHVIGIQMPEEAPAPTRVQ